ncbi:MAG: hypothetical protein ACLTYW_00010 [Collinsella sp.]
MSSFMKYLAPGSRIHFDGVLGEYLPAPRYGGRLVVAYLGHEHLGQTVYRDVVETLVLRRLAPDYPVLAVDRLDSVEVLDGCDRDATLAYLGGEERASSSSPPYSSRSACTPCVRSCLAEVADEARQKPSSSMSTRLQ